MLFRYQAINLLSGNDENVILHSEKKSELKEVVTRMPTLYHWWYVYGYFREGEGNLPHLGEVLRYYRKLLGIDKGVLAKRLACTKRYIEMLESDQNTTMPQLLSRRIVLAQILQIPPALLGLSSLILSNAQETMVSLSALLSAETVMDAKTMAIYEAMLTLSWEFYYTSSIERAAKTITFGFDLLNQEIQESEPFTYTTERHQSRHCLSSANNKNQTMIR